MRTILFLFFIVFISELGFSQKITQAQAIEDLNHLDSILIERSSYLKLKPFDYRGRIDSIIEHLPDSVSVVDLGWDVRKLIGTICDGHAEVDFSLKRSKLRFEPKGYLPFRVANHLGRVVALEEHHDEFLRDDFPYLKSINGISVDTLKAIAGALQRKMSNSRFQVESVSRLRYIRYLLQETNAEKGDSLYVVLTDGKEDHEIVKKITSHKGDSFKFPIEYETEMITDDIGYVRLERMYYKDHQSTEDAYDDVVYDLKYYLIPEAKGMIIDVRDNLGGARHLIHKMLPFFIDSAMVLNVGIPKWNTNTFYKRYLFNIYKNEWNEEEKAAVEKFRKTFTTEWDYPKDEFHDTTYYFVESPAKEKYQFKGPVVILMNETCFSAADLFLGAMRQIDRVTLVGMPSSGGSGKKFAKRLHNSRLWVWVSSMASFQPNGKLYDSNGIPPDVRVEEKLSDYIGETDTQFDAGMKLLKKQIKEMEKAKLEPLEKESKPAPKDPKKKSKKRKKSK